IVRYSGPSRPQPRLHEDHREPGLCVAAAVAGYSCVPDGGHRVAPAMTGGKPLWQSAEEGAAAVEAGVIISVLLLLVVGSVELGRAFWIYNTMLVAVEEAGRYAMVYNHGAPSVCGVQSQAAYCPALSNTPLANCAASRAREILSAYQA